jgi:hypothetical protein
MLLAPDSAERYGKKSTMPSFANKLSPREIDMLIGWLNEQESADQTDSRPLFGQSPSHGTR